MNNPPQQANTILNQQFQQLQPQQQSLQQPVDQQNLIKDSSQNRNIENFLNKSNKYSKESLQFLQEKNTLLLQQQQIPLAPRINQQHQYKHEDHTSEVNKIYEIRTQFNKFEQGNKSSQDGVLQGIMNLNLNSHANFINSMNRGNLSRDDVLIEANNGANEDLDEVQESEKFTVSTKMRNLQNTSKQTSSISKVEFKNLPVNQVAQTDHIQDIHQGERQSVNTYVLSPNISARTFPTNNQNANHSLNHQQLHQKLSQHQQLQQLNSKSETRSENLLQQHTTFASNANTIVPLQTQSQNIMTSPTQHKVLHQQHPLFFNPPSTPDPTVALRGINTTVPSKTHPVSASNSLTNLKSPGASIFQAPSQANTQRTLKGVTSSHNFTVSQQSYNITLPTNKSAHSLGYAINLMNKNIDDLSRHISTMNPYTLQILDLSSNKFSVFPMELYRMKNLKRLKLENNLIKMLPKELFFELKLESFSVQNNLIQDIPPEISEWRGCIQNLNISRNHIHTLQKYICYLENLTSLNISSNDFIDIPLEFIFLVNLREFSIDWFKYCLPPRKSTVQGNEGLQVLKELFVLLCIHKAVGYITFLQFTTHFSDKNLIKISTQIKKSKPKMQGKKKASSPSQKLILNQKVKQNEETEEQRQHRFRQLELIANQQNQENRYVLNVSNTNLLNTTITSLNDSILPKENDGIQYLPDELKKKKNRLLCINKKNTKDEESMIDNSRSLIEFINLKQISQNNQLSSIPPLSSKRQNRSNSNIMANFGQTSGACKTLIHFSSDSDLSMKGEEEVLHTHNDLSFFQESQQQIGRNNSLSQPAHRLKNKKLSKNISNPGQVVKTDENLNFDKTLQEVEEENEEKVNQLVFQQLDIKLDNPPDTLLSQREQKFMQKTFTDNNIDHEEEEENDENEQQCEIIILEPEDNADENIMIDSKEEQDDKVKSTQVLDVTAPKVHTQYNQIDPKNGRNLMHLAIIDEDISALRCLINLNFDLVNEVDFDGQTPLSLSIFEEKYYSAKILIFNKADINVGGGVFGSCLTIGIVKIQYYLIRDLIRFGADVNKQDHDGNGPLHYVFQQFYRNPEESTKIAQMLLDNGANPNLENNDKWCPLHFAVKKGCLEAVEFAFNYNRVCLLKKNKRGFMINKAGGQERITILHIASEMNFQKIVQLLLKNNADIFARRQDNKLSYQLCQKHTLVKKLLLLSQTKLINQHLDSTDNPNLNDIDEDEVLDNKFTMEKDSSFENYKKRSAEKKKMKHQSKKHHKKQNSDDEGDNEDQVINIHSDNDNEDSYEGEEDDDDNGDMDESIENEYSDGREDSGEEDEGEENLIDSADSFPIDMEDEDKIHPIKPKAQQNIKKISVEQSNNLLKNKLNQINVSSQPRMIKNEEFHFQGVGATQQQFPLFQNNFLNFKNPNNGNQEKMQEQIDQQLNDSKHSLDEIEDEDLKGDVPKWFYKDHSQIPYSPNNLQKIQGMNEIISQIIQQNTANVTFLSKGNNNKLSVPEDYNHLIYPSGIRTPEFQDGRLSLVSNSNDKYQAQDEIMMGKPGLRFKGSYPHTQQYLIQQQLQQHSAKAHTIQACNFFSNLKNYKQVIKSASNIHEYQLKILDEGLALTNRLYFLNQLKLIQFKLIQILSLITRQNIYQLFCRSGIIEDFLKLGDDNLNTLINTSQEFNRCIVTIYRKLVDQPSFDNNSLLVQIVDLFGDTCYNLYMLIYDRQINPPQTQKQSQSSSQTTLTYAQQEMNGKSNENISSNSLKENADVKNVTLDMYKKQLEDLPPIPTFAEKMKINYSNNILRDFLEQQQSLKMKKDNFTQKTLITDQDFDRMMPTEEEYETENEELTKVLSNYANIKLRNNPLSEIPKQNKIFR